MAEVRDKRRLAAILAADIVGYSRLMEADESGTIAQLKTHRKELIDPKVEEYSGRIVKTTGDGILIEFPSVIDAVQMAVDVQRAIEQRNASVPVDRRIVFRMGINQGDIVVDGDDILGDGVNIAARLEGIAVPGGICISRKVHEDVAGKLDLQFNDLGEQTLKNIARPVRAYSIDLTSPSSETTSSAPLPLPDKPSIVVLPFDNMSGDPAQDHFADGITEDIITELSRFSDLFVIARHSAFTYKGLAVKVQNIRKELGVHYVVEGSVRKSGDRVRVTVQLIDSGTGNHLWADRYDRELVDIFDVQDELTQSVVATLPGRIASAEHDRLRRQPPQDMAAYDYLLAGRIHHHRVTQPDNAEALRLLDKAIELDPEFAEAYAWKACTLGQAIEFGFSESPRDLENRAIEAVQRALSLDENNVECHRLLCEVLMEQHQLEKSVVHGERAFALNPNDPRLVAQQGELLTWLGKPEEGAEWIKKAARLDPHAAHKRAHLLGRALYGSRHYGDAIDAYKQISSPQYGHLAEWAASYAQMGRDVEAREQATAVRQINPDFSIESYLHKLPYKEPTDRNHLKEGLVKAGLPE